MKTRKIGAATRRAVGTGLALAMGLGVAACDSGLLEVDIPGSVVTSDLDNPGLAQTMVNSALGRFECAYTSYVVTTAMFSRELVNASGWVNLHPWGWRAVGVLGSSGSCAGGSNDTGLGAYTPLQQARYVAETAIELIEGFEDSEVSDKAGKLATLNAYAGYATLLLGEAFCEVTFDQGPVQTRQQAYQRAEGLFSTAITLAEAAGNTVIGQFARAGRARARIDQGNTTGAAEDAATIQEGYERLASYSTVNGIRENRIFNLNRRNRYLSVGFETYDGLTLGGEPDPRVPVENTGAIGHDGRTAHWIQTKYNTASDPIRIASWEEAQLILAEARPSEALARINGLRAAQDLPAFEGSAVTLEDIIEERRRQLYLEGHRLNDMLRFDLPFPTGFDHRNEAYGSYTCIPLPDAERNNNPNL